MFLKHVYTVDATTKAVSTTQAEASLVDIINPEVVLADPVSRTARFVLYSLLVNKLLS